MSLVPMSSILPVVKTLVPSGLNAMSYEMSHTLPASWRDAHNS
jgi:hypothetical protein